MFSTIPTTASATAAARLTAGSSSHSNSLAAIRTPILEADGGNLGTVSTGEQPILSKLIGIRNQLAALKKDRGNYYRPDDIVGLYDELRDQVWQLQKVRSTEHHDNDAYTNRVDSVLDECFQLFSLFYLALGKNKEIPATYVQLVTIKQNFELFNETGVYTDGKHTCFCLFLVLTCSIFRPFLFFFSGHRDML